MADILLRETLGPVAVLTLNRPPVNALNTAMYKALIDAIAALENDRGIRVMILQAAPGSRTFCAGGDIKEFGDFHEREAAYKVSLVTHEVNNRIEALPQITIAAFEADVLGGGGELALAFDLRVASTAVRFGFPEVKVGQLPGTGGTMRLPWLVGESAARGLLLTGDTIDADRAHALGLFHKLVSAGSAHGAALAWAQELAERPAQSVLGIKRSIVMNRDRNVAAATLRDTEISTWVHLGSDAHEGYRAFVEKRSPRFTHAVLPWPKEVPLA